MAYTASDQVISIAVGASVASPDKQNKEEKMQPMDSLDVTHAGNSLHLAERERLSEMALGATEAQVAHFTQRLGHALAQIQELSLSEQQVSWDRLATSHTIIANYMPPVLQRGAVLAVFDKNYATALPFLRAATVLCDGWAVTIAHLLIASCCKEQGDTAGMDVAIEAFAKARSATATLELRSMIWRVPSLDKNGYDPLRGPDSFPDIASAIHYVRSVEKWRSE